MGVVLLEAQLGVIMNRMRHVKQHARVPVHEVSDLGSKRFSGHRAHVTGLDHDGETVGFDGDGEVGERRDRFAVKPDLGRPVEVELCQSHATLGDQRVRHMGAGRQSFACLYPVAETHRDLKHVDDAVVRVAAWRNVPAADELRVHHDGNRSVKPTIAGDTVSDKQLVHSNGCQTTKVDREHHRQRPRPIQRPTKIATGNADHTDTFGHEPT